MLSLLQNMQYDDISRPLKLQRMQFIGLYKCFYDMGSSNNLATTAFKVFYLGGIF